ncbi:MAG: hypothetical protein RSA10_03445 [Bacilli bacterium]
MKKINTLFISFILLLILFLPGRASALEKEVNVYLFYGDGCPHCRAEKEYLDTIKDKYNLKIYEYEVWYNKDNQNTLNMVADYLKVEVTGVPFTVINNTAISGYSEATSIDRINYNIKQASNNNFIDKVGMELGIVEKTTIIDQEPINKENNQDMNIKVPFFGKVNLKNLSLPVIAIIIGLVDGFNPCAMWVLLFLISTLIGMKDKKKLWILGTTFLLASSTVYLAFMVSWLQFARMISAVSWVRLIIALVALIGGVININSFIKSIYSDDGCNIASDKKRKKTFNNIKKFTHEKSFAVAMIGIVLLAISVNLIELACSAGLPVIFTQILAMNSLSGMQYALYILLYILFFMLDDFIIFIIAIKSFELSGVSTKYSKYSHLVGGIIMFIIGVLLLVKPEWLMFNF